MTAAQEPRAGEVLTAESVKLLRSGDVLRYEDTPCLCTVESVHPRTGWVNYHGDGFSGGHDCLGWTFVSRPSESSASGRWKSRGQIAYEGWSQGLPGCEWANQTATQMRAWELAAEAVLLASPAPDDLRTQAPAREEETMVVPLDTGPNFSDSTLPLDVIHAGADAIDQATDDMANYVSGETTDWDSGMMAVAVYRAMTAALSRQGRRRP